MRSMGRGGRRLGCVCAVWMLTTTLCDAAAAYEKDMTITVDAGRTDCFYQHVDSGQVIDIEYQVIDGTYRGELDISFQLSEPQGRVLLADYKKPENSHRHTATAAGDYRFCFDNSFSTFSSKTVFFDLVIDSDEEENNDYDDDKEMELHEGSQNYLMRVGDILESVARMRDNVSRARRLQEQISAHEARDRNLAEDTNASILRNSLFHLTLLLLVGGGQIFFLKNLFERQSAWLLYLMERWSK